MPNVDTCLHDSIHDDDVRGWRCMCVWVCVFACAHCACALSSMDYRKEGGYHHDVVEL